MSSDRVVLNVGGQLFHTYKSTLTLTSNYFRSMFESGFAEKFDENEKQKDEIFIDRDPDNFKEILRYMRDNHHCVSEKLAYEFDFFGIEYHNMFTDEFENYTKICDNLDNETHYNNYCLTHGICLKYNCHNKVSDVLYTCSASNCPCGNVPIIGKNILCDEHHDDKLYVYLGITISYLSKKPNEGWYSSKLSNITIIKKDITIDDYHTYGKDYFHLFKYIRNTFEGPLQRELQRELHLPIK